MALLAVFWLMWTLLAGVGAALLNGPLVWAPAIAAGMVLLQWWAAPAMLQAMVRFDWSTLESHGVGVLEDVDAYLLTFGRTARSARTVVTRGLLDRPHLLALALKREAAMRHGVGAATAACVPLLLCRYLTAFFLGAGQQKAFREGLGSGVFVGVLADLFGRMLARCVAPWLRQRHERADARLTLGERRRLLIPLYRLLTRRTSNADEHLKRSYAAAAAVFAPLDAAEACGLELWRHHSAHPLRDGAALAQFHPPLGQRIGRLSGVPPRLRFNPVWVGLAAGLLATALMPGHFGWLPVAIGLAWLVHLWQVQKQPKVVGPMLLIKPGAEDAGEWPELVERPLLIYQDVPWALQWRPVVGRFDVFLPPPVWPVEAILEVHARIRHGPLPELEVVRAGRLVNRTVAAHTVMALLLVLTGGLLEAIAVLSG